ncbi:MAG: hypothetical protein QOK80_10725 [Nitrososphaeraceae archaeon]|nr:hypothetical protein [Nitrososphaeraceae archaeon]
MFSDENLGKAIDFVNPKVNSWAKDLFGARRLNHYLLDLWIMSSRDYES